MTSTVTAALCGVIASGDIPADDAVSLDEWWDEAAATDVEALLAAIVHRGGARVAEPARARAMARLREATARELARHEELRRIGDALAGGGIRALLLKGAGLAYTTYSDPRLRPGDDIDLFIARSELEGAESALSRAGYGRAVEPDAELASMQRHYLRADGGVHWVDLHWRVSNRHVFAGVLEFEECWRRSIPVPALSPAARTLGVVDALLLACVHRVAHHPGTPSLLWLYDVHLLARQLTPGDAEDLASLAERHDVRAVIRAGLDRARELFGTPLDGRLLDRLRAGGDEPTARFVGALPTQAALLRSDLRSMRSTASRFGLLREHLLPSAAYMRARYPRWPALLLPLAYVHRAATGAPRWLRRPVR
jgi:hypothetical protein